MIKIKLLCDTTTTITEEAAKKINVDIVHNSISDEKGDLVFVDDLTDSLKDKICKYIEDGTTFKTSLVSTGILEEKISSLLKTYDKVVYLTLGPGYSSQFSNAIQLEKIFPGKLIVLCTETIAINSEVILTRVAKLIEQGIFDINEYKKIVDDCNSKTTTLFTTPTFEGLIKTGRVSVLVAKALKLVKLFPVIACDDINRKYAFIKKWSDSKKQLLKEMDSRFKKTPRGDDIDEIFICHSLLDKNSLDEYIKIVSEHYEIPADKIQIRTTPLVVIVATLRNSIGIIIKTKNINKNILK